MRDHMMGFVQSLDDDGPVKPYPLGLPVGGTPAQNAREARWAKLDAEEKRLNDFETGDHMLPGMKQSDFPKEYDTRVAIEDRFSAAYDRALREMADSMALSRPVVFGYDEARQGSDRTAIVKLTKEKCDAASQRLMDELCGVPAALRGDRAASHVWLKATEVPWPGSSAMTPEHKAAQREKNATLTELMLKMQAAKQRQWEGRALGRIPHWL